MDRENLVEMIKPVVTGNGCDFWGLELVHGKNTPTIRVFIDAIGGPTIEDCEKISHELNLEFSLDDSLIEDYILEVSSPGLDRKIFYPEQLLEYVNEVFKVKLREKVNNLKTLQGVLEEVDKEILHLKVKKEVFEINFNNIESCKLMPDFKKILGKK